MIGTYRTAFNGSVRGKVVSVTSTGVVLGGQNGMVREINARYLDPIETAKNADGTRDKRRARRFTPKPRSNKPVTAETSSPKVSKAKEPKPAVVEIREATMSDYERLRSKGLITATDRTQYADK